MIHDSESLHPIDHTDPRPPAERVPATFYRRKFDVDWQAPRAVAVGASVEAFVNDGRWVARCVTFPACSGAELVSRSDPRLFCCSCQNVSVGGLWVSVVFPKNADAVEAALDARPLPTQKHWAPGETVVALRVENITHGVGV